MKHLPTILAALTIAAHGGEVKIVLPPETGSFKAAAGAELAQANCLICHSVEYIATQPPMPRKFWEGSVKKMREKYGAPTPEDTVAKLVDYLAGTYGVPDAKK